jgi:hypothetical protein
MAAMTVHSFPVPQPDPGRVRPGRVWYAVAMLLVVLGVAASPIAVQLAVRSLDLLPLPAIVAEFGPGSPATVELSGSQRWAIYVENADPTGKAGKIPTECAGGTLHGQRLRLIPSLPELVFEGGNRRWYALYEFEVPGTGRYQVSCRLTDAATATARYAVAAAPDPGDTRARLATGVALTLFIYGAPVVGVLAGATVALVVALRRNASRRRPAQ